MMNVYLGAINDSKVGADQYVLEKSLDIFRTHDEKSVVDHLSNGWELKGVCINGVLYSEWLITPFVVKNNPLFAIAHQRICDIIGHSSDRQSERQMRITTQEYFDKKNRETIYMTVELWKESEGKPDVFYVTPKSRTANKKLFDEGQENAMRILDLLTLHGIKQDKDGFVRKLRAKTVSD
jgi:hypothetical protein